MSKAKPILKYIGDGSFIPNVPARDLTEADIKQRGLNVDDLLRSGLYQPVAEPKKKESSE